MSRRARLLSAVLLLLAAAGVAAEAPWRLGEEPREFALENGLSVILQRDAAAPITVVHLLVRAGDRDDPPGSAGLAYLTARLCLEISDPAALRRLMDLGSSFSLAVGGEHTSITIRCLSRHLDATLAVLAGMLGEPLFSDLRVDGVKDLMRMLQRMEADDPDDLMRKTAAAAFYGGRACGAARFGDAESLARIGRRDIQAFYRDRWVAGNMVAVVVSDLGDEVQPLLARRLGALPAGGMAPLRPLELSRPDSPGRVIERQAAQALVSVSLTLPARGGGTFVMASLLESWLGKGIGSRLWRLRARGGLAYGLGAEVVPHREAMLLSLYLKTDGRRLAEARTELSRLLRRVHEEGIDAAELAAAVAYARASFWRENESRERRAALLAFLEGSGLSYRLAGDFAERLGRVGLDEFNSFLRAALAPERWYSLSIGPSPGREPGGDRPESGKPGRE